MRATGLAGLAAVLLAVGAVRAEPPDPVPCFSQHATNAQLRACASLTPCLLADNVDDMRSCAEKYISVVCRATEDDDFRGCQRDVRAQVQARITAENTCIEFGQTSACAALPDKVFQSCLSQCFKMRDGTLTAAVQQEQMACEARYVQAGGRGTFACSLAGAIPDVDVEKLKAALRAAVQGRDGQALDAFRVRNDGQFLSAMQPGCTKACNERGSNVVAIAKQGPGLVSAYKRCVMAADSTPEARKLDAYEVDLYCDYLQKANARCRTASRCDWLEQYSAMRCTYNSVGVDRCQ